MTIQLMNENVLTTEADAILLPIDGQARELGGTVARSFSREWPEAYELFESRLRFPVALGRAIYVREDVECRWKTVIFLATLHHLQLLSDAEKSAVMASAFSWALSLGVSAGLGSISTAILRGGWRLSLRTALARMVDVYEHSEFGRQGRRLNICCLDPQEYQVMLDAFESRGRNPAIAHNPSFNRRSSR